MEACRWRGADRRIIIGLPILVAASIAALLIHVNVIGEQDFIGALKASAESPLPPLSGGNALGDSLRHQVNSFGWIGILMASAGLVATIRIQSLRPLRSLTLGLFFLGALNFILFPMKAPREDFWGCYWLPLMGLSGGIVAEMLMGRLRLNGIAVVVAASVLAGISALTLDWDETAQKAGETHKAEAQWLSQAIPEEDRGLLLTNAPNRELKITMAYTRVSMLFEDVTATSLDTLPTRVRQLFHVLPKGKILFVSDPANSEAIELMKRHGSVYRGIPFIIDVTEFISAAY